MCIELSWTWIGLLFLHQSMRIRIFRVTVVERILWPEVVLGTL
jgi:hypothetical protein